MAQAPMPMPGDAGGATPGAPDPTAPDDSSTTTLVTICKTGDGSYIVYQGDEPDSDDGPDMSADDADAGAAPGAAPSAPSAQGQPADSIGAALKLALDIMQSDASSEGAPGSADDQFAAGFSADKSPTPAGGVKQKY